MRDNPARPKIPQAAFQVNRKTVFLALITMQALHSVEEYLFWLYDLFLPARVISGLISPDLRTGFLVINSLLVAFGIWSYVWPVRREWKLAVPLMWLWVGIELINGVGHPLWSLLRQSYTPGVITALVLLPLAVSLAMKLRGDKEAAPAA